MTGQADFFSKILTKILTKPAMLFFLKKLILPTILIFLKKFTWLAILILLKN